MGKFEETKETMVDGANEFMVEHPVAASVGIGLASVAAMAPLCALAYKWAGKCAGKAAARELMSEVAKLGRND